MEVSGQLHGPAALPPGKEPPPPYPLEKITDPTRRTMFFEFPAQEFSSVLPTANRKDEDLWEEPSKAGTGT